MANTVGGVITSVYAKVVPSDKTIPQTKLPLETSSMEAKDLGIFLSQYAPMQLVADRESNKLLPLPRKTLDILTYLLNAHLLVNRVESSSDASSLATVEKYHRLSKLLSVSSKASLPHPSWKPFHDAVLVSAVAKHGWIDKEVNCRAITNDEEIKWGKPFGEGDISLSPESNFKSRECGKIDEAEKENFKNVALRAVEYLNSQKDLNELKGFNLNLVLKTYGIVNHSVTDDDGQVKKSWKLDPTIIESVSDSSTKEGEYEELPTRKDLLKRAKTILSKPIGSAKSSCEEEPKITHDFVVLDQGNILNIFLAELLRDVVKQNSKNLKLARKSLSRAQLEIGHHQKFVSDKAELEDLAKLVKHIALVQRCIKKSISRPVKNVLRAILGMKLINSVNASDEMFVSEKVPKSIINLTKKDSPAQKSKPTMKQPNESAVGDLAINRAIAVAKNKAKNGSNCDVGPMLGITTVETLILSVMCSQGIPLFTDDWERDLEREDDESTDNEYSISWCHLGNVLEVAAEKWVEISQIHLKKAQKGGYNTAHIETELQSRQAAYKEAMRLHQKPIHLAKKTIMMIEAIRLHMGPESKYKGKNGIKAEQGIGTRVFSWNKNHLSRWAKALDIFVEGKTMSATVMALRPDSTPAGFLDKKNCKSIYTQISQQTRLRSIFTKYVEDELFPMVSKAEKNV